MMLGMRGREAAKAAGRRAQQLLERAEAAEAALTTERTRHHDELAALKTQLAQERSQLVTKVQELSKREIDAVITKTQEMLQVTRTEAHDRVIAGLVAIERALLPYDGFRLPAQEQTKVAAAFGIEIGEWLTAALAVRGDTPNRNARRVTNRRAVLIREERSINKPMGARYE